MVSNAVRTRNAGWEVAKFELVPSQPSYQAANSQLPPPAASPAATLHLLVSVPFRSSRRDGTCRDTSGKPLLSSKQHVASGLGLHGTVAVARVSALDAGR